MSQYGQLSVKTKKKKSLFKNQDWAVFSQRTENHYSPWVEMCRKEPNGPEGELSQPHLELNVLLTQGSIKGI